LDTIDGKAKEKETGGEELVKPRGYIRSPSNWWIFESLLVEFSN